MYYRNSSKRVNTKKELYGLQFDYKSTVHVNSHLIIDLKKKNKRLRSWINALYYSWVILVDSHEKICARKIISQTKT